MQTEAEFLAQATIGRSDWAAQRHEQLLQIAAVLASITRGDELWQRRTRGLGPTDARREAIAGLKTMTAALTPMAAEIYLETKRKETTG